MLCKILRTRSAQPQSAVQFVRSFGSDIAKGEHGHSALSTAQARDLAGTSKGRARLEELKQNAFLEYKKYPNHIGHWNPESPDYVESPREEDFLKRQVKGYNDIIDNFKNCLKLQEELYDAIEKMDRPYLKGTPGIDANVYSTVKDYSVPFEGYENQVYDNDAELNDDSGNQHRYIRNEMYIRKGFTPSNIKRWQQEIDERPVNDHYNHDKGYKFDVPTPYEQRAPHVADRLGHPYLLGNPIDRLFRLEQDTAHPAFIDQPFVQVPPVNADANVNFQEGEVIYENPDALEWGEFWQKSVLAGIFFGGAFAPYHYFVKNTFILDHLKEGMDIRFFEFSAMYFDNYGVTQVALIPVLFYATRYAYLLTKKITQFFPSRVQYNADKDLLFVTVPGSLGDVEERVIEMDHVEIAPASFGIGNAFLSANQADGYYTITDLNAKTHYHIRKDAE